MTRVRLVLGTAQFGLDYGITNKKGRVEAEEVAAILQEARLCGIDMLDTAIAYGNSEEVLGHVGVRDFRIVSKLPPLPDSRIDVADWVEEQVYESLQRLKIRQLRALLLHRPSQLLNAYGDSIVSALIDVRNKSAILCMIPKNGRSIVR